MRELRTKHGHCAGGDETSEFRAWSNMRERCGNPEHKGYKDYGARGIAVSERWAEFSDFLADMGEKPDPTYSLERLDNSSGYGPENCVWASPKKQARNRRNNRILEFRGESALMCEWAERVGLPYKLVKDRLHRGWNVDAALTEPVRYR